jgi:hypothetical protein
MRLTRISLLGDLEVSREVLEHAASATTSLAATEAYRYHLRTVSKPCLFFCLQHLDMTIAPCAMMPLARIMPASLMILRLRIACHTGRADVAVTLTALTPEPPLVQLVENWAAAAAATSSPSSSATLLAPCLPELMILYNAGSDSAAELAMLSFLPQLHRLNIGWWTAAPRRRCSNCCLFSEDAPVEAPDFGDADLERLLTALPRLRQLAVMLRSCMTATAPTLANRVRPQLEELELRGSQTFLGIRQYEGERRGKPHCCACLG